MTRLIYLVLLDRTSRRT